MALKVNLSCIDCLSQGANHSVSSHTTSTGVASTLASVLIFTIVVDIVGNVLVILSVYRNKKLRNAGMELKMDFGTWLLQETQRASITFFSFVTVSVA